MYVCVWVHEKKITYGKHETQLLEDVPKRGLQIISSAANATPTPVSFTRLASLTWGNNAHTIR